MEQLAFFQTTKHHSLYPLTLNKPLAALQCGTFTIAEFWELFLGVNQSYFITEKYLQQKYQLPKNGACLFINAAVVPNQKILNAISNLKINEQLIANNVLLASYLENYIPNKSEISITSTFKKIELDEEAKLLQYPWQLAQFNKQFLELHFKNVINNRENKIQYLSQSVNLINPNNIFIEESAVLNFCSLNANDGPIYIGKNSEVMEGALIRGPFSLGDNSVVKMGAKIYGATSVGKNSVVGGEIKNSIISSFTNKSHDGYLGDSFLGEWCNIGAGTSNSNVKNTASEIKIHHFASQEYVSAGIKCGVIIADYTKAAINTSFNTGSLVGICCNVFGSRFHAKHIASFTWGAEEYIFESVLKDISKWMEFKNHKLQEEEIDVLKHIFNDKQIFTSS